VKIARPKRRTVAIVGLWFVPVAAVVATAGNDDSIAIGFCSVALLSCPLAFAMARWRWGVSKVLCVVGAFNTLGSASLCLLAAVFVASVDGLLALGLLVASAAGGVALGALGAPRLLIAFESVAALLTVVALTLIAFDSSNVHNVEGGAANELVTTTESWSFLYLVWGFALATFVVGGILAIRILLQPQETVGG